MNEFNIDQAEKNFSLVYQWIRDFSKSRHFNSLSPSARRNTSIIVISFTDMMYSYEGERPHEWNKTHIQYICDEIFPRHLVASEACFMEIPSILFAFFNYLADSQILLQAREMAEEVAKFKQVANLYHVACNELADNEELPTTLLMFDSKGDIINPPFDHNVGKL